MRRGNRKGFTLLELIIVVIIIGILASIALPRYIRIAEKGRVSEAKSILGAMRSAQMRYAAQFGVYTDDTTALDLDITTPKYYDPSIPAGTSGGDPGDEAQVVATCTRNTRDASAAFVGYVIDITMSGDLIGDATAQLVM